LTDFLFTGSSALLLSIISVYPDLWFLSLFVLIPFLWRAIAVTLLESVRLAVIVATAYCLVAAPVNFWASPAAFLSQKKKQPCLSREEEIFPECSYYIPYCRAPPCAVHIVRPVLYVMSFDFNKSGLVEI
jgi:hypothetical protein